MNANTKWLVAGSLTIAAMALFAQAPGGGRGGSGGFGGGFGASGGRGRGGGGGGGGFVAAPTYDKDPPVLPADLKPGGVLIYSKTNGFREEAALQASDTALAAIAHERGWPYFVTENGAVMNKEQLAKFKVVVWNNNSGDTLTSDQREAFKTWVENGGSYVGTHGAGGDPKYDPPNGRSSLADWPWYIETLLGAQFTSHSPQQFGDAHVEDPKSPLTKGLPAVIHRYDEWYAFATNPRSLPGYPHSDHGGREELQPRAIHDGRGSSAGLVALRRQGPRILFRARPRRNDVRRAGHPSALWQCHGVGLAESGQNCAAGK
jgi:hypothetical protein